MRRVFTLFSVVVHAIVITALLIAQVLAVGALPTPRRPLTFDGAQIIRVTDIPLQPSHARSARGGGLRPGSHETSRQSTHRPDIGPRHRDPQVGGPDGNLLDAVGVERGLGAGAGIGGGSSASCSAAAGRAAGAGSAARRHAGAAKDHPRHPIYPRVAKAARIRRGRDSWTR